MKKPYSRKIFRYKRSFLLLEALIALSLVVLCFFPLVKSHFTILNSHRSYVQKMQLDFLAKKYSLELKERLYKNEPHSFSDLVKGCSGTLESENEVLLGEGKKISYTCEYEIKTKDSVNKNSTKKDYLLLEAKLFLIPLHSKKAPSKEYPFAFIVEVHRA